jgi:hypothetical protein
MRNGLIGAGVVIAFVVAVWAGMQISEEQDGPGENLGKALDKAAGDIQEGVKKATE